MEQYVFTVYLQNDRLYCLRDFFEWIDFDAPINLVNVGSD